MASSVGVYRLKYDINRKIIKYPNKEYYCEEYTQEDDRNDSELCLQGQTLLGMGKKIEVDHIKEKAEEEFKKIMNKAFNSVSLPDIEVVTEMCTESTSDTKKQLIILESKTEEGHSKWTWNFNASECRDSDLGPNSIEFECSGIVYVQYKRMKKSLKSHVIQYKMKRIVTEYGSACYDDCRPCEIEQAEEHFDDEMGYNLCGEKVIGYNLTDTKEINDKAYQLVQEEVVNKHIADYVHADIYSTKIVKSISKDGFNNWEWSFSAEEEEYECTLEYEGSIVIISKKTPNPNIPNPHKKQRFATKAPARMHKMRTKIIGIFSDAECERI